MELYINKVINEFHYTLYFYYLLIYFYIHKSYKCIFTVYLWYEPWFYSYYGQATPSLILHPRSDDIRALLRLHPANVARQIPLEPDSFTIWNVWNLITKGTLLDTHLKCAQRFIRPIYARTKICFFQKNSTAFTQQY